MKRIKISANFQLNSPYIHTSCHKVVRFAGLYCYTLVCLLNAEGMEEKVIVSLCH